MWLQSTRLTQSLSCSINRWFCRTTCCFPRTQSSLFIRLKFRISSTTSTSTSSTGSCTTHDDASTNSNDVSILCSSELHVPTTGHAIRCLSSTNDAAKSNDSKWYAYANDDTWSTYATNVSKLQSYGSTISLLITKLQFRKKKTLKHSFISSFVSFS